MIYKNKKPLVLFLLPAFAFMVVFLHYPFVMNILNSFQNIAGLAAPSKGWLDPWYSNYVEMLHDKNVWIALKNTLILMGATLVFEVGMALVLAILVDQIRVDGEHRLQRVDDEPFVRCELTGEARAQVRVRLAYLPGGVAQRLPVEGDGRRLVGALNMHDLFRAKVI